MEYGDGALGDSGCGLGGVGWCWTWGVRESFSNLNDSMSLRF